MKALFLLGSSRRGGNTEQLARVAATALPPTCAQRWLRLDDHPLAPFVDRRHAEGQRYVHPALGHERVLLDATLEATELVFAVPTYWYSLPASTKSYLDHWSAWLRLPDANFKSTLAGRRLWVITVNSDDPGVDTASVPLIETLRLTAEYMSMTFGGSLVGHANRPGEISGDAVVLERAKTFFAAVRDS